MQECSCGLQVTMIFTLLLKLRISSTNLCFSDEFQVFIESWHAWLARWHGHCYR